MMPNMLRRIHPQSVYSGSSTTSSWPLRVSASTGALGTGHGPPLYSQRARAGKGLGSRRARVMQSVAAHMSDEPVESSSSGRADEYPPLAEDVAPQELSDGQPALGGLSRRGGGRRATPSSTADASGLPVGLLLVAFLLTVLALMIHGFKHASWSRHGRRAPTDDRLSSEG